jgi:chromosome segregation ATPase
MPTLHRRAGLCHSQSARVGRDETLRSWRRTQDLSRWRRFKQITEVLILRHTDDELRAAVDGVKAQRTELEELRATLQELTSTRQELARTQQELASARQVLANAPPELASTRQELADTLDRLNRETLWRERADRQLQLKTDELLQCEEDHETLKADTETLKADCEQLKEDIRRHRHTIKALKNNLHRLKEDNDSLNARVTEMLRSTSWRISAPFRLVSSRMAPSFRKRLRGLLRVGQT